METDTQYFEHLKLFGLEPDFAFSFFDFFVVEWHKVPLYLGRVSSERVIEDMVGCGGSYPLPEHNQAIMERLEQFDFYPF